MINQELERLRAMHVKGELSEEGYQEAIKKALQEDVDVQNELAKVRAVTSKKAPRFRTVGPNSPFLFGLMALGISLAIRAILIIVVLSLSPQGTGASQASSYDSFLIALLTTVVGAILIALFCQVIPLTIMQVNGIRNPMILVIISAILTSLIGCFTSIVSVISLFLLGVILAIYWLRWQSLPFVTAWFATALIACLSDLIPQYIMWAYDIKL